MHPFILFALASALSVPGLADDPMSADPLKVEDPTGLIGQGASVEARSSAGNVSLALSPDDVGLYIEASLPGPGFSRPVDAGSTLETVQPDQEKDQQSWGPAVPVPMPSPAEAAVPAGIAALGAAAWAAFRWRYLGPWFMMPLYSRLSQADILENETRALLLETIEDSPGLALQELAKVSGAGWGTTVYHLQRLEQAGFVKSRKQGHHRRFYKAGEVGRDEVEALGMLRNDTPRQIAQYLLQDPGCNQKSICEALDISPSLAHKYLKRMEEQELVTSQREWRSKHYTPDDRLAGLVKQAA